ncbi:MAG: HAD family hydrolase [Verrucomicrobiota bacterium]
MQIDLTQIKVAFIDLDGTLIDHSKALYRCFKYATSKLGEPVPSQELVQRSVGGSMPVTMRKFVPEEKIDDAIALWRERFEEIHLEDIIIMPGAHELLDAFDQEGIKAAVFTNKIGRHSRAMMTHIGLADRLLFTAGAEDTPYRKPQPEFAHHVLEKAAVAPEKALMIGDSPFDIAAAKNVGMTSFVVPTGSHTAEELAEDSPDQIFPSLTAIADHFKKLRETNPA